MSIARIGLKTPISVQYRGDEEGFFLVAGRHRLQACIELGWTDIPVLEEGSSSLDARMWEIAENLHRADLTALEHDEHVAEWMKLADSKPAQVGQVSGGAHVGGRAGFTHQRSEIEHYAKFGNFQASSVLEIAPVSKPKRVVVGRASLSERFDA